MNNTIQEPLVSVIIPAYNYCRFIEETINNVTQQTYSNLEVIIVDDGSTDDTKPIVKSLINRDNRIKYHYQSNQGLSGARNSGIKLAKGEYCLFLDADDLISKEKLKLHVEHFKAKPYIDISYSKFWYFKDNPEKDRYTTLEYGDKEWMKIINGPLSESLPIFLISNNMVVHSPVIRKRLIDKVGFFDENMKSLEDWDYWLRCLYTNANICYLKNEKAYSLTRIHERSMSQNKNVMRTYEFILRNKIEDWIHNESELDENIKGRYKKDVLPFIGRIYKYRIASQGFLNIENCNIIVERLGFFKFIGIYLSALRNSFLNFIIRF